MDQAETLLKLMKKKGEEGDSPYSPSKGPRMITVCSGKGGVGKTNLATNLAIGMVRMGQEVVVMDADLGLANVNIMLGIMPKYNIYNFLNGEKSLAEVMVETEQGIKVIAGASGFTQLADLGSEEKKNIVRDIEALSGTDIVFVDTGAGISDNVLSFVLASHECIVVTTPEPTAITDAYGIIKSIAGKKGDVLIRLLVNRVQSEIEGTKVAERIVSISNQFLNVKVENLGFVFEDPSVSKAVLQQKPFFALNPKSKASKCILDICLRLQNLDMPQKRGFLNFFKSLVDHHQKH